MRKLTFVRIFIILVLSFWCTLLSVGGLAVSAAAEQGKTIKTGIFTGAGYAEQDQGGKWHGIDIEMLENVAQTAGFRVDFVPFDSAKEGLHALETGQIDMLADIAKTSERETKYLFCEYEQGNSSTNIFVRQEDERWIYGEAQQIKAMRLGAEQDNIAIIDLQKWCQQYGFTPNVKEYATLNEAVAAVKNGELNGCVDGEDYLENFRSILSFAPAPYYVVFAKYNSELKSRVDAAFAQIYNQDPLYEKELFDKYIGTNQKRDVAFTWQEKGYMASKPELRVAVLQDDAPYFYGTEAEPQGILPQFYTLLGAKTGLRFTYQVYRTQDEVVGAVTSGEADIVGMYSAGLTQAYDMGLSLSKKYSSVNMVMIYREGIKMDNARRIAVKERSVNAILPVLPENLKKAELQTCNTAAACFEALKNGQVDVVIIGLPSATYLMNQTNSSLYAITPFSSINLDLCAGVSPDNRLLASILSKSISSLAYSMNGIIANNTVSRDNWQTMLAKIPPTAIVSFAVIMILLVLLLIGAVISLIKSRKVRVEAIKAQAAVKEQKVLAEAAERGAAEKLAFFSNISHDMRTPLNAINGFAGLAIKAADTEQKDVYLGKIKSAGAFLNDLINDTLTLVKVNNGKLELKPQPVAATSLIATVADPIRQLAEQRGVNFKVELAGLRERMVLADKLNVSKIIMNLLSNAIKFTEAKGQVRLQVQDVPAGAEDPDILVTVQDDGIGMTEEFLQHIFEPFSQERRHGYEALGTGLGMSIVKKLVDLMGGSISVTSSIGKGSTFLVQLHLPEVKGQEVVTGEGQTTQYEVLAGKRVLLCEDNPLNREIAMALLKDRDLIVDTAVDGQQGVDKFAAAEAGYYDIILMDLHMPILDGCGATRAIRKLDRSDAKKVPVLALTGDGFAEDTARCMDAGMNGYLLKPINPRLLYAALAKHILGK